MNCVKLVGCVTKSGDMNRLRIKQGKAQRQESTETGKHRDRKAQRQESTETGKHRDRKAQRQTRQKKKKSWIFRPHEKGQKM